MGVEDIAGTRELMLGGDREGGGAGPGAPSPSRGPAPHPPGGRGGGRGGRGGRGGGGRDPGLFVPRPPPPPAGSHPPQFALRPHPPRGPSLLDRLLSKEVRRDRSRLLQCFRLFVANDFLVHLPGDSWVSGRGRSRGSLGSAG